jgi:dolichol-phosphate mannosyltransferase
LTDQKSGLGVSYLHGFDKAIKEKADAIIMMDADLSHPPKLIPRFVKEIEQGADLVIGSRYIKDGGTPDWNAARKMISAGGNFFARVVAGLHKVHDCTSGYRAIRVEVLKQIDKKHLATKGYAFMSTLLFETMEKGINIREIPLVFYDRKKGRTKLTNNDIIEFFFNSIRLFFKRKLFKFAVVGASGIAVNLFFLWLFFETLLINKLVSSALAIEISILGNFLFNNYWTFRKNKVRSAFLARLLKFNLITLAGGLINWLVFLALTNYTPMYYLSAQFIGILIAFAWNYLLSIRWAWRTT